MTKRIYGVGGTNGAGKDAVSQLLVERHGYMYVSVSDVLRHEAERRGLPAERRHLSAISAEWRKKQGLGVLVTQAMAEFKAAGGDYNGVIIGSLRNSGEADRIHELGGQVLWVDATPEIRYDRIRARNRGLEDDKTYEEFLAEEAAELHMPEGGDAAQLNGLAVKERADVILMNETSSLDELNTMIIEALDLPRE